jgi:hypothetical protein
MFLLDAAELADLRGEVQSLMATPCVLSRSGAPDVQTVCSIVPERRELRPTDNRLVPSERWLLQLPLGIDARTGDRLGTPLGIFLAVIVRDPRTIDLARQVVCYQLTTADGRLAYLSPNATVNGYRGGAAGPTLGPAYAGRRVEFRWAAPDDRDTGMGIVLTARLFDTPDAAWRRGDWVDIGALDGITASLPLQFGLEVHAVHPIADPLARVEVDLIGDAL